MSKTAYFAKLSSILGMLILIALPVGARAQESEERLPGAGERLELRQLIGYAYRHNPSLRAARLKWAAVIERYPQVTAYKDPVLQYTHFIENVETRVGPQQRKFSLSQEIPFPGKLSLQGEIVAEEVKIARREFEKQTRDLIVQLKSSYYELAYLEQAIELTKQNKQLLEHLATVGTSEYSLDGTTLNDVFQAQSQLAQVSYDLILLAEFRSSEITRLNALLNRPAEAGLGRPHPLEYRPLAHSLEELYQLALRNRQELAISELDVARRAKKVKLAELEYLPDFKLGFDYTAIGAAPNANTADSGQDAYAVNVGISIPLWFDKNRARVNEARSRYEAALYRKRDLENQTLADVKKIYFKLQNSQRLIRLYRESLIPQAAESMEAAESWFKTGKGSFAGLLETQAVWLNFNLAWQRALADYYQRIALLEQVVGATLSLGQNEPAKKEGAAK